MPGPADNSNADTNTLDLPSQDQGADNNASDVSSSQPQDQSSDNNIPDSAPVVDESSYLLPGLPERGSTEYAEAFNKLSFEDQLKIEDELNALNNGQDETLLNEMKAQSDKTDEPDPENKDNVQGDTEKLDPNGDYDTITKEVLEKLPQGIQKTVIEMNKQLEEAAPFMTKDFQAAFEQITNDPVIKERMETLKSGNTDPNAVGAFMQEQYDPNGHVSHDCMQELTFDPKSPNYDDSVQKLSTMLYEAAQKGHSIATANGVIERKAYESKVETKVSVEKQLNEMVGKNPSMKSDLEYQHDDHPLGSFFQWVSDSKISGQMLVNLGVEHVFSMYQSKTGGMNKMIQDRVSDEKKKLFLNLEEIDNNARNFGKTSQVDHSSQQGQMYNGIDLNRYKSDTVYRSKMFDQANDETQRALENYAVNGEIPQNQ